MTLSKQAISELRTILETEVSLESVLSISDQEIEDIGLFYLEIFNQALKQKSMVVGSEFAFKLDANSELRK